MQGANRYIEEKKPWQLSKADEAKPLDDVLRALLEVLRVSSILSVPFMPTKAAAMREQLGLPTDVAALRIDEATRPGDPDWKTVGSGAVLFPRFDMPKDD